MKKAVNIFYFSLYNSNKEMTLTKKLVISIVTICVLILIPSFFIFKLL
jgi:hypothetical protein